MKARRGAERGTPVLGFCGGDHGHGPRAAQQAKPTSGNGGVENHFLYLCRQRLVGDRLDLVRVVHRYGAKANTHGSLSGHRRRELLHRPNRQALARWPSRAARTGPFEEPRACRRAYPTILGQPRSLCGCRHWLGPCSARHRASIRRCPPPGLRWRRLGRARAAGGDLAPALPALRQSAGGALLPERQSGCMSTAGAALRRERVTIRRHASVKSVLVEFLASSFQKPSRCTADTPGQTDGTAHSASRSQIRTVAPFTDKGWGGC